MDTFASSKLFYLVQYKGCIAMAVIALLGCLTHCFLNNSIEFRARNGVLFWNWVGKQETRFDAQLSLRI